MDPYLQSLVETRQQAISCLKGALENVDEIAKSVAQLNRQIEAHRPRPENPSAEASGANNGSARRAEIVPNVAFSGVPLIPLETLESASQAYSPREPDTAAPPTVAVKNEVDENAVVADGAVDESTPNEEVLDSVMASLAASGKSKATWLHPVVRLETLQRDDATKRKRGRPPAKKRPVIGEDHLWAPSCKKITRWQQQELERQVPKGPRLCGPGRARARASSVQVWQRDSPLSPGK